MTDETPQTRAGTTGAKAGKAGSPRATTEAGRAGHPPVRSRPDRYLVAAVPPVDIHAITEQLSQDPSCRIIRVLGGSGTADAGTTVGFPGVAVIEMTPERAAALAANPAVLIEPDCAAWTGPAAQLPPITTQRVTLEALDDAMRPIEGATIAVTGTGIQVTGYTGPNGRVEITAMPEVLSTASAIEVHPPRGCWPRRVPRPLLSEHATARVTCTRITTTCPDFPEGALDSWGARAMGFDRLPPTYRGNGVKVALIDSGAATGHPDLSGLIEHGRDFIGRDEEKGWQEDLIGTGTHHATLIAGRDDGAGIVGLSPEAQVYICRVTPGGSAAELIEALDYCIDQQVDVVMLGAWTPEQSGLLAAKVDQAWRDGIACIAPASWSAPSASPRVLSVGAIGQLGTFPADYAAAAELSPQLTPEGFFIPSTGTGPGGPAPGSSAVDCCAPGFAVIGGLPPSSYGPLSGPGSAAAHVTALAALILAHHPQFRREPRNRSMTRDAARPARLLEIIRGSCRPLPQLDPAGAGAGIPDAAVALSVAPWGAYPPLPMPYPMPEPGRSSAQPPVSAPGPVPASPPEVRISLEPLDAAMAAAALLSRDG